MMDDLMKPAGAPTGPFYIDRDGDIADADGWFVCRPTRGVWGDDAAHAQWILEAFEARDRIEALTAERDALAAQVVENENLLSLYEGWLDRADKARLEAIAERAALAEKLARAVEATNLLIHADENLHQAISTPGANVGTARVNALEALDHLRTTLAKLEASHDAD